MKARRSEPVVPLSPELRTVLLDGPWAVGKTLWDIPPHDELRRLWAIHGAELLASRPRPRPWFLDRDYFVRAVRGEDR